MVEMRLAPAHILLTLGLLAVTAGTTTDVAHACSCSVQLRSFPEDGATRVPLNVKPTFFQRAKFRPDAVFAVRALGGNQPYPVEVTSQTRERFDDTLVTLAPSVELSPETYYELLLDDRIVATFQTGLERDEQAPAMLPLQDFAIETMKPGQANSCVAGYLGVYGRLRMRYPDLPADAAYYLVSLRTDESEFWSSDWVLLSAAYELTPIAIRDQYCEPEPPILRAGQEVCASIQAYDLAGNASDSARELCATAVTCDASWPATSSEPAAECLASEDEHLCGVAPGSRTGAGFGALLLLALGGLLGTSRVRDRQ